MPGSRGLVCGALPGIQVHSFNFAQNQTQHSLMENPNNNNQERALARRRGFEEISQTQAAILRSQQGGGLFHFNEDDPGCFPCQLFFLVSHFIIAKVVNDIRKTLSGAILDPEDKIKDVLDDNDFVSIVLETDRPNPSLEQAEVSKYQICKCMGNTHWVLH